MAFIRRFCAHFIGRLGHLGHCRKGNGVTRPVPTCWELLPVCRQTQIPSQKCLALGDRLKRFAQDAFSIRRRLLHVINHQQFHRPVVRLQLQPQLLLHRLRIGQAKLNRERALICQRSLTSVGLAGPIMSPSASGSGRHPSLASLIPVLGRDRRWQFARAGCQASAS